jgi:hypothetical protein
MTLKASGALSCIFAASSYSAIRAVRRGSRRYGALPARFVWSHGTESGVQTGIDQKHGVGARLLNMWIIGPAHGVFFESYLTVQ